MVRFATLLVHDPLNISIIGRSAFWTIPSLPIPVLQHTSPHNIFSGWEVSERTKAVAKVTRDATTAAMFKELLNGCSIVFSGVMLACK